MEKTKDSNFFVINIIGSFTPKVFYEYFLKELGNYFRVINQNECTSILLFIDLSDCKEIEGSVIPNLLVTGKIIKRNTHNMPILYIPENGECKIMNYLKEIQFEEINEFLEIFYIKTNGGMRKTSEYKLPDYCTTLYLNKKLTEERVAEEIQKRYITLFTRYLEDFIYEIKNSRTQKTEFVNLLEIFCKQICYNAIFHGNSFCFVTMQANQSRKKVFISISDGGKGMFEGFKSKLSNKGYKPILLPDEVENIYKSNRYEMDGRAIIEGITYRFGDYVYGLWNVLKEVMNVQGIIRIHSGKARVIISDLNYSEFEMFEKKEATKLLYQKLKIENCIKETPDYSGTHVEIELPLRV